MQAKLLLCHVTRRVSESQILSIAEDMGFEMLASPSNDPIRALINEPFRLLWFGRKAMSGAGC